MLLVHLRLQRAERGVDLFGRAALLVNGKDALLEVDAGLDGPKHLIGGAEDAVEEAELLAQQLEHAAVGLIAFVQEVDDHHVVPLPVAVAAADALLDALRVPGQVVVDDQRAELQVDAFRRRLGGEQDRRLIAEVLDERGAHIHGART